MAKVIFENLTKKQADILADWFEGQGESDCAVWFDDRDVPAPITDVGRKNESGKKLGYRDNLPNGDVIVYMKG